MRFSYVIPYRSDESGMRATNLKTVLAWLSRLPQLEVVLVEQDGQSRVEHGALPSNSVHVFVENAGPFNKSWALNVGFMRAAGDVVAFGDADMILNGQTLMNAFEQCVEAADAVKPYDRLIDLTPDESRLLIESDGPLSVRRRSSDVNREGLGEFICFCGGIFVMKRNVYLDLGGFDEGFIGWGCEDDAMSLKVQRLGVRTLTLQKQAAFHLWHDRNPGLRYSHHFYEQNAARLQNYTTCSVGELRASCAESRNSMGDPRKYASRASLPSPLPLPQRVLFISPVIPAFAHNGLAMRAASVLKLLAQWRSDVHLFVIPLYNLDTPEPSADIAALCRTWRVVRNPQPAGVTEPTPEWAERLESLSSIPSELALINAAWRRTIEESIQSCAPDLVVIFRFYLVPFVLPLRRMRIWLDVDELESETRQRLAVLYALRGGEANASRYRQEASAYEKIERHYFPMLERVFAASNREAENIRKRFASADVRVLPNTYPSISAQPPRPYDGQARLLYVGSLGYYPNRDAIAYFATQILPLIRQRSKVPVEVVALGGGSAFRGEDPRLPGVHFVGPVPETTSYYADCDAVIVPLRAGGGTRIKILEAFSHRRAVISTIVGAEGLDVTPDVHLKLADNAEMFAQACLDVIHNPEMRDVLADNGHEFFKRRHSMPVLMQRLPEVFG